MNKEQLKQYIVRLDLEDQFQLLLFDLIDGASQMNKALLETVADFLDLYADFNEKVAQLYEREAEDYEAIATGMDVIDAETEQKRLETAAHIHEEMYKQIEKKIEEIKTRGTPSSVGQTPPAAPAVV